jgi:hypothetical protein
MLESRCYCYCITPQDPATLDTWMEAEVRSFLASRARNPRRLNPFLPRGAVAGLVGCWLLGSFR